MKRKWYRFTLRKVVIGFVLLSVLLAYLRYTHWGYVATEAITKMGRNAGLANPPDRSKIHVTAVRPFGTLDYEWRISIPPDEKYLLCYQTGHIPEVGYPDGYQYELPNEALIVLQKESSRPSFTPGIRLQIATFNGVFPVERSNSWGIAPVNWTGCQLQTSGVLYREGTCRYKPGEKIVLMRTVVTKHQGVDGKLYSPGDGILVWLEPEPSKAQNSPD